MKFFIQYVRGEGARLGQLTELGRQGNLTIETPMCLLFTRSGIQPSCADPENIVRERSGSVVECLTRDRGGAGSSLTRRHCIVVLEQDTFILA